MTVFINKYRNRILIVYLHSMSLQLKFIKSNMRLFSIKHKKKVVCLFEAENSLSRPYINFECCL